MLVAGVIEHEVQRQRDAVVAQLGGQLRQLLHGAKLWVHLTIAADRITAVVVTLRPAKQRHQMQVGDAQLGEVGDALAQPGQVAGEQVHVAHGADHAVGLEPIRVRAAHRVECLEFRRARDPHLGGRRKDALQVEEEIVVTAVEAVQLREQARKVPLQAFDIAIHSTSSTAPRKRRSSRGSSRSSECWACCRTQAASVSPALLA